ncbi:HNH endonuclease signature motif containing protein [Arthrobacter sp. TMS2-4]
MAIAPVEDFGDPDVSLGLAHAVLMQVVVSLEGRGRMLTSGEAARTIVDIEDMSRVVDYLQVLAAGLAEERDLASGDKPLDSGSLRVRAEQWIGEQKRPGAVGEAASGEHEDGDASGSRFRSCTDYLRARLGISRAEAKRRLELAHKVLPGVSPTGAPVEPQSAAVSAAFASGTLSGRAATVICSAVDRVRCLADPDQLVSMEHHLTRQALEADEDVLRVLARRWETVLDQDGQEPTEKILRSRQGVFLRGRRNGLRILEIGATDEQYEHLVTAMTTATNPRMSTNRASDRTAHDSPNYSPSLGVAGASPDRVAAGVSQEGVAAGASLEEWARGSASSTGAESPTRAQSLLDGLVGACRIALSTSELPATGGHRPQVMVTIDYRDLLGELRDTGGRRTCGPATTDPRARRREAGGRDIYGAEVNGREARGAEVGVGDTRGGDVSSAEVPDWDTSADGRGTGRTGGSGTGRAVFSEQLSARAIRRIACDADLIPLVLGGKGQVLDIGRAGRLFPPHLRRALVARDRGCAFPDCTVPASWCEAHHLTPWSRGGGTSIDNGVLLCAHHHHTIHDGGWTVASHNGIPWFTAPPHLGRHGTTARRNRYWHAEPRSTVGAADAVSLWE